MPLGKPSSRKTIVDEEVKEVAKSEIKRARFFTIVEETITTNPDDFLLADSDLEHIYFGSDTESETDSTNDSNVDFLYFKFTNFSEKL